ncbi:MAG: serine acetyltransferase [Planctomycetota bacterium]|nr:serine acetyltransferase [Planctomycetota bacterium]
MPAEAIVGARVLLEHYAFGIVMHPNVTIGDDCQIYHHVTIAGSMNINSAERVCIGNRVSIGTHTVIIAPPHLGLSIGDDVVIGAGAVVTGDVPDRAVVVGVPAKIIRFRSDEEIQDPYGWSLTHTRRRTVKDDSSKAIHDPLISKNSPE